MANKNLDVPSDCQSGCKVSVRLLPPELEEEHFRQSMAQLNYSSDDISYFHYIPGVYHPNKPKSNHHPLALLSFVNRECAFKFMDEYNGHVFQNEKRDQYRAVVACAPSQRACSTEQIEELEEKIAQQEGEKKRKLAEFEAAKLARASAPESSTQDSYGKSDSKGAGKKGKKGAKGGKNAGKAFKGGKWITIDESDPKFEAPVKCDWKADDEEELNADKEMRKFLIQKYAWTKPANAEIPGQIEGSDKLVTLNGFFRPFNEKDYKKNVIWEYFNKLSAEEQEPAENRSRPAALKRELARLIEVIPLIKGEKDVSCDPRATPLIVSMKRSHYDRKAQRAKRPRGGRRDPLPGVDEEEEYDYSKSRTRRNRDRPDRDRDGRRIRTNCADCGARRRCDKLEGRFYCRYCQAAWNGEELPEKKAGKSKSKESNASSASTKSKDSPEDGNGPGEKSNSKSSTRRRPRGGRAEREKRERRQAKEEAKNTNSFSKSNSKDSEASGEKPGRRRERRDRKDRDRKKTRKDSRERSKPETKKKTEETSAVYKEKPKDAKDESSGTSTRRSDKKDDDRDAGTTSKGKGKKGKGKKGSKSERD